MFGTMDGWYHGCREVWTFERPLVSAGVISKICRGRGLNHGSLNSELEFRPLRTEITRLLSGTANFRETFRRQKTLESILIIIYF
jgi:hypothetical protein